MISAMQSAISGLHAFSTRLQSNANNVANIESEGFKRTRVINSEQKTGGVQTTVDTVNTPGTMRFESTNNGEELIELSNVDLSTEIPEMLTNSTYYKANIKTAQIADDMIGSLMDIKA